MDVTEELKIMRNGLKDSERKKKKNKSQIRTLGKAVKEIERLRNELAEAKQIDMGLNV